MHEETVVTSSAGAPEPAGQRASGAEDYVQPRLGSGIAAKAASAVTAAVEPVVIRKVSRRRVLAVLGAAGAGAAAVGTGVLGREKPAQALGTGARGTPATASKNAARRTAQWAMVLDLRRCDGCKACTMACQQRHYLHADQTWIKVYKMTSSGGQTYHMPRPCMMCEDPPCMYVCPVGATFRNDEGIVLVDQSVCIGCRTCMAACPYEARYFNWSTPKPAPRMPGMPQSPEWPVPQVLGTVGKCVWCADRLPHGELPACVQGCPMGVIYIGDLVSDVAVNSFGDVIRIDEFIKKNDAVRFKEELGTNPRVWYVLGHDQSPIG